MQKTLRIGVAAILTIVFALPLYLAVVNVFKTQNQISYHPISPPNPFTLENLYSVVMRGDRLLFHGLQNSLFVVSVSLVLLVILSSVIGFYIARHNNRWTRLLLLLFVAGMMVPPQVTLIPVTRLLRFLRLMGTYPGLILYYTSTGLLSFAVFVFTGFVKSIPRELDEAAVLDGAGGFQLFWKVIFPLMRPATASVAIFLSLWMWNDFLNPLIILGPARGITITTGIYTALGQYSTDYGQMFALMFLSALPVLALYFALQKEFISGLTGGAIKG